MNSFSSRLQELSNTTYTENGAKTYRSTLSKVLDFFYLAPARQDQDNTELFVNAFDESPLLAMKVLFYIRDARGGKGQKRTFKDVLNYLANHEKRIFNKIVQYVPEYGYWKDILPFVYMDSVRKLVTNQLVYDIEADRPSLLGKWMPSENATSKETIRLAKEWMHVLDVKPAAYRKMLSGLRKKINIVEAQMSAGEWEGIEYSHVPSRAMKLYRKAFERHDEDRFKQFLTKAIGGEAKINADHIYPHEIVKELLYNNTHDLAYEALWKNLPDYFAGSEHTIMPLIDVSSSMSQYQVMHIGIALGMYCAERNVGPFKDLFITFSENPAVVKIKGNSLRARINSVKNADWGGSTDLQKAFELILRVAKQYNTPAEEMPSMFMILSDMEFNSACRGSTNFDAIRRQFERAGYDMPMLVFWNLNARHDQAPVTKSTKNAYLVSGFSVETIGKIFNAQEVNAQTPEELMLNTLNSERYAFLDNLVK